VLYFPVVRSPGHLPANVHISFFCSISAFFTCTYVRIWPLWFLSHISRVELRVRARSLDPVCMEFERLRAWPWPHDWSAHELTSWADLMTSSSAARAVTYIQKCRGQLNHFRCLGEADQNSSRHPRKKSSWPQLSDTNPTSTQLRASYTHQIGWIHVLLARGAQLEDAILIGSVDPNPQPLLAELVEELTQSD